MSPKNEQIDPDKQFIDLRVWIMKNFYHSLGREQALIKLFEAQRWLQEAKPKLGITIVQPKDEAITRDQKSE